MTIARKRASRRGASLVEFAFTLPIILLIFFGFIELARANMIRNSAKNAAYMGARRAVIPGGTAAEAEQKARFFASRKFFDAIHCFIAAKVKTS